MPTKAKVITAILNWNGSKMLQKFLPSVVKYSTGEDRAVAVIDNCSDDDSVDVLKAQFPEVGIITLDRNYGFAEGYNRGLEQLDAEYFVLLNSDVEVTEGWMDSIIRLMDSNRDIAAAQPKLMSEKAKDTFEYSGAYSARWKKTKANMTPLPKYSGHRARQCSSEQTYTGKQADWTNASSHTWKR